MPLIVNNNPASIAAQRNLTVNTNQLQRSVERLSSGLRITRAADDAAGLGVSETLRAQIRSINQATRNANDGISLTQVADGAAATIGNLLSRLRELSSQSASGTVGATERSYLDQEFVSLRSEIDRIATVTEFNGQPLLSGSTNSFEVFIGFKSGTGNSLTARSERFGPGEHRLGIREHFDVGECAERVEQYRQRDQFDCHRASGIRLDSKPLRGRHRESSSHE